MTLAVDGGLVSEQNFDFEVILLPYLFVLLAIGVCFRPFLGPNIVPHAWHFTPLAAWLLFFGARGSRRQMWYRWYCWRPLMWC